MANKGPQKQPGDSERDAARLRRKAEDLSAEKRPEIGGPEIDKEVLLHELEVHQIELELQNEELKRAQRELEFSRDRYADLFDFAPVGYFVLDRYFQVLEANLTGSRMLGIGRSLLFGKRFSEFVMSSQQDAFYLCFRAAGGENGKPCELEMHRQDGVPFFAGLKILEEPASDVDIRYRVSVTDITERKRIEEELALYRKNLEDLVAERTAQLQRSENNYRTIVETANEGIWLTGDKGKALFVNRKMADMLGYTPEELVGHDVREFVVEGEIEGVNAIRQELQRGEKTQNERKFRRKDGSIIISLVAATPRFDEQGNYIGNFTMHTDITERKRAEEELRKFPVRLIEAQEQERRRIGRELHDQTGQYLTALKLLLTKLARDAPQAEAGLKDAAGITVEVLQQVRELSHTLRPPMIDELGLVPALHWQLGRVQDQAGLVVNLTTAGFDAKKLPADINMTAFRIIQEAITNVMRHAGVKEANVTARISRGKLLIRVADKGRGFDLKDSAGRSSSGIITMRERAALVGGKLTVRSAPGKGTTVTAELPLAGEGS